MREYIIRIESDKPLPELIGENLRASIKITGDFDEIIRCKDCVHNFSKDPTYVDCENFPGFYGRTPDNYCSLAERKEE